MKLLNKYLKPFVSVILLAVVLLFVQAFSNLSLPNFMSDMVDTGIQKGGLGTSLPKELNKDALKLVNLFSETDFTEYYKKDENNIYNLVKLSKKDDETLLEEYNKSVYSFFNILRKNVKDEKSIPTEGDSKTNAQLLSMSYEALKDMPEKAVKKAQAEAESASPVALSQMGSVFTKINYSALGQDLHKIQVNYILDVAKKMVLVTIIGAIATIAVNYISAYVGAGVAKNMRKDLFTKIMNFSSSEYNSFKTSSLITRTTNDITQVQGTVTIGIKMLLYSPIMGIWGFLMALDKAPSMSWIIGLAILIILIVVIIIFAIIVPKFELMQKIADEINLVTRENLTGLMVIRAFNNKEKEKERFDKVNKLNKKVNFLIQVVMGFMMPVMNFIMTSTILAVIWFGAKNIEASNIQVGDMMAFIQYSMQIIMSFLMLTMIFVMVPRAMVSLKRINEVFKKDFTILDPENPSDNEIRGEITFDHVTFRYGDADDAVLDDINLTINKGDFTAIVGTTGAGKSTLVNLIMRFLDVSEGRLLLDGVDIRDYSLETIRNSISYVPQKSILFKGDIKSNMHYGDPDASDEEILDYLQFSDSKDFVEEKGGLETNVAQMGSNFSGGQKQRLSIARALIKKAEIYIFDDSFSALDASTDSKVRANIRNILKDETIIVVAQRLGTILNADKIIVLDKGKVVGMGTHEELLKTCETYKEIAATQLNGGDING